MAAETQPKTSINDPKKRKRRFLPHNKPVKKKGPSPLRPGVQGFFMTCDGGRERDASYEALNVIDSRRFSKLDTGCNGVAFIQMRRRDGDPGPREIVQHMMDSAARTKKHMSRFLLRVLPVEVSCYASAEEIPKAIKSVIERYFPVDAESPVKFAVQYDARANSGIERMKIIDAVAKSVTAPHKVDLKNPEKTIIVQIIKTVCLVGVVEKYNLRHLTSPQK